MIGLIVLVLIIVFCVKAFSAFIDDLFYTIDEQREIRLHEKINKYKKENK